MPCDIGYKSYSRVSIPVPQPQKFKSKAKAPKVDADLLARLGQEDHDFLVWMQELDIGPLLQEALKRALQDYGPVSLKFSVSSGGQLVAEGEYKGSGRRLLEEEAAAVSDRWQMEVLQIVVQLLGYETVIERSGSPEQTVIEGEKDSESGVHEYVRVARGSEGASVRFEHFRSKEALDAEKAKFLALAQKLGVKIDVHDTEEGGRPIAQGVVHRHFLKGKG